MTDQEYSAEFIPVSKLSCDPRINRGLDTNKAQQMYLKFDWNALGILTVSRRANGDLVIIDGQHRWEAAKRKTSGLGEVPCHVFAGKTLEQEAELFLRLNTTTKPRVIDKFKVRVTAGDEAAVTISKLAASYGWTITPSAGEGAIQAVAAIERIYHESEDLEAEPNLVQAVFMVIRPWNHDRYATNGPIFEGIGKVLAEYGSKVDLDRLEKRLGSYPGGPEGLLNEARQHAGVYRMKVSSAVAELVTVAYNKGLQSNALPRWTKRS